VTPERHVHLVFLTAIHVATKIVQARRNATVGHVWMECVYALLVGVVLLAIWTVYTLTSSLSTPCILGVFNIILGVPVVIQINNTSPQTTVGPTSQLVQFTISFVSIYEISPTGNIFSQNSKPHHTPHHTHHTHHAHILLMHTYMLQTLII
jgi:hypothetical protein